MLAGKQVCRNCFLNAEREGKNIIKENPDEE
jgi:hypothetical protein